MRKAELAKQLRLSAMNLLARREHSRQELVNKLGQRKQRLIESVEKQIERHLAQQPSRANDVSDPGLIGAQLTSSELLHSELTDCDLREAQPLNKEQLCSHAANTQADIALAGTDDFNLQFGFSSVLNEVLDDLTSEGLLDEQRYAEAYIRSRSRSGFGPMRISSELQQRGLQNIDKTINEIDWTEQLSVVVGKKCGDCLPGEVSELVKLQRFLLYRGFPSEMIGSYFKSIK